MTPYRPKGSKRWWVTLTTRDGRYIRLPTKTYDKGIADQMQAMLVAIQGTGRRWWDVVDYLETHRRDLPRVFDHWVAGTMEELRAELADVDLAEGLTAWEEWIKREFSAETVRSYLRFAAKLFPRREPPTPGPKGRKLDLGTWAPTQRSRIMARGFLARTLQGVGGSNTNRARCFAAWSSVMRYLVQRGDLEHSPMSALTQPPSNAPVEDLFLDTVADVKAYLDALPDGAHRALAALREGAGIEISAALRTRRRDIVDAESRVVYVRGTKNKFRARQVVVDAFAWEYVWRYVQGGAFLPQARLFPVTERAHRLAHNETCAALREKGTAIPEGYTLHKARNTYTVRHLRAGDDPRLIAENLGHQDERMILQVYGRRRPKIIEMVRAQQRTGGTK